MPETRFKFKQFDILHEKSAHKVGTDGVLLGSWVRSDNTANILDVGSGSGLISLMLAQRFPKARVTGIEIDHPSYVESLNNIERSPFASRITIQHTDFKTFDPGEHPYDLIVSNPPFFKGAHSSGTSKRDTARHESYLPHDTLIKRSFQLLTSSGTLAVVLPYDEGKLFMEEALQHGFYLERETMVIGSPGKNAKRILIQLKKTAVETERNTLTLRNADGSFSAEHLDLTGSFYL